MVIIDRADRREQVSAAVRRAMLDAGVRQADIAEALGLSQSSIAGRLGGRTDWRLRELVEVARVLGVPLSCLLAREAAPLADTGAARPAALVVVVAAAWALGWVLPAGVGLAALMLGACVGVAGVAVVSAHRRGMARLAAHRRE